MASLKVRRTTASEQVYENTYSDSRLGRLNFLYRPRWRSFRHKPWIAGGPGTCNCTPSGSLRFTASCLFPGLSSMSTSTSNRGVSPTGCRDGASAGRGCSGNGRAVGFLFRVWVRLALSAAPELARVPLVALFYSRVGVPSRDLGSRLLTFALVWFC